MSQVEERIQSLGFVLGEPLTPLADYVPAVRSGSLVFTSGQLPMRGGSLIAQGPVHQRASDEQIGIELARECAARCALNGLAAVRSVIGDLDRVVRVVKVVGYVAVAPGFMMHANVVDGASEFLGQVFGDRGKHARSAVGVASLPCNAPVEIELVVEVSE